MRAYKGFVSRLWCIVMVAWTCQAALSREPDPGEKAAGPPLSGVERPDSPGAEPAAPPLTVASICLLVEEAAQTHGLPLDFFARLIWQESRFNPDLVGPTTRGGQRAQGIAQFMPDTAKARGAFDPFDPSAALPKSAEFLRELRTRFGNLGLAAAAYNAGPKRVRNWLAGRANLPGQTRTYVSTITGRSADEWARRQDEKRKDDEKRRDDEKGKDSVPNDGSREQAPEKRTSCSDLIASLKADRVLYADDPEERVLEGSELQPARI